MDSIVSEFIDETFGNEILKRGDILSDSERMQIVNSLILIVFSHRCSKNDRFILEGEDDHQARVKRL